MVGGGGCWLPSWEREFGGRRGVERPPGQAGLARVLGWRVGPLWGGEPHAWEPRGG